MKKIIINLWFGVYNFKIKGEVYRPERSAVSNFVLSVTMLLLFFTGKEYAIPFIFFIMAFGTFIYFKIWPVKWSDLDNDIQKWYYGYFYFVRYKGKVPAPKDIDKNEWDLLNKKYSK